VILGFQDHTTAKNENRLVKETLVVPHIIPLPTLHYSFPQDQADFQIFQEMLMTTLSHLPNFSQSTIDLGTFYIEKSPIKPKSCDKYSN
jgi:hypothetical protein